MTLHLANSIRSLQFTYGATSERILPVISANLTMVAVELAGLTFNLANCSQYTTLFIAIWQFYFCFYFDCRTCYSINTNLIVIVVDRIESLFFLHLLAYGVHSG